MLRKSYLLSQNSVRLAISETVRPLQGGKSDQEFAEEWGTSAGTVANARNRNHTIGLEAFLRLGKEYRAHGVDTALALIGLKSLPLGSIAVDVGRIPRDVAECVPHLIERLIDGHWSEEDQRAFEKAGLVHCFLTIADKMREMRDSARLRPVA